jgi:hypothetical protein
LCLPSNISSVFLLISLHFPSLLLYLIFLLIPFPFLYFLPLSFFP